MLTGGVANAALGNGQGQLTITPASGPIGTTASYQTSVGCPAGFQGSAVLRAVDSAGQTASVSPAFTGTASPFGGQLQTDFGTIQGLGSGVPNGGTQELVVVCFQNAGLAGSSTNAMDAFVTYSADGNSYSVSKTAPAGPTATTTVVTAQPNPAQVGATVTLTATVTAASGTPAGTVQFEVGGTAIGAPVAVNGSGVASTTTTFAATGAQAVTAAFTPADTTAFASSTSAPVTENVSATNPNSAGELITVTVAPTGTFTFGTADNASNPTVALTQAGQSATGNIDPVVVNDTRTGLAANPAVQSLANGFNGFPGWSVVGQAQDFTNPNSHPAGTIPGTQLGWTPSTPSAGDFTLGGVVTPGTGLSTAQTLASAGTGHGFGTSTLSAALNLAIPTTAPAGAYTSTLTLTANPTANFS
jgi:hypothetical protein